MDHSVQFRDFMMMYNRITENCFNSCVYDLNERKMNNNEANCVQNCFWKHLNSNNRLMVIFSELQAKKQEREKQASVMAMQAEDITRAEDITQTENITRTAST